MKQMKYYSLLLLVVIVLFGCSDYDDTELRGDINDLKSRVEKLESWCKETNEQIAALQLLTEALESQDYVTGISPIVEGTQEVGYTITFSKSGIITIMNGKDGEKGESSATPVIGVKQDSDGHYYWTIKIGDAEPVWMTDSQGKKIRTTGDKGDQGDQGDTPALSVGEFEGQLYWKVDGEWLLNNGEKVSATGERGDAIFAKNGIKVSDNNVTFTLADGIKITLPLTKGIAIRFDSYEEFTVDPRHNSIKLVLPANMSEGDYTAIKAEVTNNFGVGIDIKTRAASSPWTVEVRKPIFDLVGDLTSNSARVKLTAPIGAVDGDVALLKVTIIDNKGNESSSTRVVKYSSTASLTYEIGDLYPDLENPIGIVFWIDPSDATKGKIVSLAKTDAAWGTTNLATGVNDVDNGAVNMKTLRTFASNDLSQYPAFKWCNDLDKVNGYSWYMPALNEVKLLTGGDIVTILNENIGGYDPTLPLIGGNMWASNEHDDRYAETVYGGSSLGPKLKTENATVRAVAAYGGPIPATTYKIGDLYPDATNAVGVVFWVDPNDASTGKAISLAEDSWTWGPTGVITGANNKDNGAINMETVKTLAGGDLTKYSVFEWCDNMDKVNGYSWYLPAQNEISAWFAGNTLSVLNQTINNLPDRKDEIGTYDYWSSTEKDGNLGIIVKNGVPDNNGYNKSKNRYSRAVLAFGGATPLPPSPTSYAVGDLYPNATNPVGVVVSINEGDATHGKIMSLQKADLAWGPRGTSVGNMLFDDGVANMVRIKSITGGDLSNYPAFKWCDDLPKINKNGWYLPASNELREVISSSSGIWDTLNNAIQSYDPSLSIEDDYWASSEDDANSAYRVNKFGSKWGVDKTEKHAVRAFLKY